MSFSYKSSNPLKTAGAVIYENRDNLFYSGVAVATACEFIHRGHLNFYTTLAPIAREYVRGALWGIKSIFKPSIAGDHSDNLNCGSLAQSSMFGAAIVMVTESALMTNSANLAITAMVAGAGCLQGTVALSQVPGGIKGVIENYKKMWNYTDDDDQGPKHTQRVLGKIKDMFGKASEWIGSIAPQPQQQPVRVPNHTYLNPAINPL